MDINPFMEQSAIFIHKIEDDDGVYKFISAYKITIRNKITDFLNQQVNTCTVSAQEPIKTSML